MWPRRRGGVGAGAKRCSQEKPQTSRAGRGRRVLKGVRKRERKESQASENCVVSKFGTSRNIGRRLAPRPPGNPRQRQNLDT
jgi:hypothetical protein